MRAAQGHIRLWHLPPHPVRADRRDAQAEVGGNLRGRPPLRRRVRLRLVDSHTSIVAVEHAERTAATLHILASRYVKAGIDPGKSTADLKDVAASAEKDAPDDIEQDRIPREAQQAEKDYFSAMQQQNGQ